MRKVFLSLFTSLILLGSCATLQEQYAEAVGKEDYDKALSLAETAKGPEQAEYFTEIAVKSRYFSPEKKADLLVRAGTPQAKEALVKLGEGRIRERKYEEGEKFIKLAGLPQEKVDAKIGTVAASEAEQELFRLNSRVEDKELLQSKDRIDGYEKDRNSFEATRTFALDRLKRSGESFEYPRAAAHLLGGDLRVEEAEKIIAGSKIDERKKLELTCIANMQAAWSLKVRADAIAYEIKSERKPERQAKGRAGIEARLLSAAAFARKAFTLAVSLGDEKYVQNTAKALVNYALDARLGDKADLESARYIHAYYKKEAAKDPKNKDFKEWLEIIPISIALTGAYDAAEALFKEDGIPASEYGLTLSRVAENRKDASTVVAKYLILSGDRAKMEKAATEWASDAARVQSRSYSLSSEEYKKKKAAYLLDTDAAAAIATALKNIDLYNKCITVAYDAYDQFERMEGYSRAFGVDEKTMCSRFAAMCEKSKRFVKAAEYYGRIGDRPSQLRVAETMHKNAEDSYDKQVSQMNLYLAVMAANVKSGFSIQEYKKKYEAAKESFIASRSYWIKDLKEACSILWSLKEKQKAFDALEFLAQLGAKEEVRELQAKWLVDEQVMLEILKRADEKANAASKTKSAP